MYNWITKTTVTKLKYSVAKEKTIMTKHRCKKADYFYFSCNHFVRLYYLYSSQWDQWIYLWSARISHPSVFYSPVGIGSLLLKHIWYRHCPYHEYVRHQHHLGCYNFSISCEIMNWVFKCIFGNVLSFTRKFMVWLWQFPTYHTYVTHVYYSDNSKLSRPTSYVFTGLHRGLALHVLQ